ncbi:MAG: translation initiation factor IF-5A [Thaumarchaeota archaeon]|jgi:translation initiation factor 5A|nr:translation initiation factor IF-5A [Candidatus Geocrenenecus arthurdayi]MCL7389929.1 translation initiation factor IF-5A [Candidatus Geocrenenecus arthurdayi]MCL7396565.1 translation initiation factor IF-5A [Candidatus Geocrenenecus arthurdayi]MCL7402215.1 translation initiation factor IF-5A [Candidatus Geocrenenecus arthurdayi]
MSKPVDLGSLKVGHNIVIDGEPCRIVELEKSKPGKHGSAKVRLVAIGIFDGVKRTMVGPADTKVEVPIIEKRSGQVVSVTDTVSLMDNETLEIIEVAIPQDETIRSKLEPGTTVEYWKVMGRYMITHVRES